MPKVPSPSQRLIWNLPIEAGSSSPSAGGAAVGSLPEPEGSSGRSRVALPPEGAPSLPGVSPSRSRVSEPEAGGAAAFSSLWQIGQSRAGSLGESRRKVQSEFVQTIDEGMATLRVSGSGNPLL